MVTATNCGGNSAGDLEALVVEVQTSGLDWIDAKLRSDQLEADEKNFLAALMNDLEKTFEKIGEGKLERLARGSEQFRDYVVGRVLAQSETGRKKVLYEAKMNVWEAKRSQLAFDRVKLERGLYQTGRG